MDARAARAREEHKASRASLSQAREHRLARDRLILALHADGETYKTLASAIGCSPELIAKIVQGRS